MFGHGHHHGHDRHKAASQTLFQSFRIFIFYHADKVYCLTVRHDVVVLAPTNPGDEIDLHWYTDMVRHSTRVKDATDQPSLVVVSRDAGRTSNIRKIDMAKRERSEERGCRSTSNKRPPAPEQKKHLYLLIDDWERGYSVRRLDVEEDLEYDAGTNDNHLPPTRFTEPPVARIEAEHDRFRDSVVSHGTKIFAMQPGEASLGIPAFDTRTLALSVCTRPSGCRDNDYVLPLLASAAGKLFLFTDVDGFYLGDQPPYGSRAPWSWSAVEQQPPFRASQVKCYALHPDGRTLFVSADDSRRGRHRSGTFSLDVDRLEWTRRGDWLLPFAGQAYFDAELEAWVGLCGERDSSAGRLCSCDVLAPPVAAGVRVLDTPPSWKIGEDMLFREDYSEQLRLGAKLVYMGGHSKFCLVEFLFHKDDDEHLNSENNEEVWPPRPRPRRRRVLNLTTFGVKYNKDGQLRTSMLQRGRACKMYRRPCDKGGSSNPMAFWL